MAASTLLPTPAALDAMVSKIGSANFANSLPVTIKMKEEERKKRDEEERIRVEAKKKRLAEVERAKMEKRRQEGQVLAEEKRTQPATLPLPSSAECSEKLTLPAEDCGARPVLEQNVCSAQPQPQHHELAVCPVQSQSAFPWPEVSIPAGHASVFAGGSEGPLQPSPASPFAAVTLPSSHLPAAATPPSSHLSAPATPLLASPSAEVLEVAIPPPSQTLVAAPRPPPGPTQSKQEVSVLEGLVLPEQVSEPEGPVLPVQEVSEPEGSGWPTRPHPRTAWSAHYGSPVRLRRRRHPLEPQHPRHWTLLRRQWTHGRPLELQRRRHWTGSRPPELQRRCHWTRGRPLDPCYCGYWTNVTLLLEARSDFGNV